MRRSRLTAIALTALVLGTGTAACSSDAKDEATMASTSAAAAGAQSFAASAAPAASSAAAAAGPSDQFGGDGATVKSGPGDASNVDSGPGGPAPRPTAATVVRGRVASGREDIIKNATISIETADVDKAHNDAMAIAEALDADVSSATRAGTTKDKNKSATMMFRVFPAEFDKLVTQLSSGVLGEVVNTKTTTEDVTGQVADIEGRIRAAKDSADKIRALIAKAEKITDLVTLEREYAARDAEIQSMASQVASLKDRAGRSTVTLSIGTAPEKPKEAVVVPVKEEETGFVAGLKSGWTAFSDTTRVLATVTGALLPFLVVFGIVMLIWWMARRRRPARIVPVAEVAPHYATPVS